MVIGAGIGHLHMLLYAACRLTHRLQVLLDDERHERLQALARERGASLVATIVREALDRGLPVAQGPPPCRPAASLLAVSILDGGLGR